MNIRGQSFGIVMFLLLGVISVFILYIMAVPLAQVWDDISTEFKKPDNFGSDERTMENIGKVDSLITPAFDQFVIVALFGIILAMFVISLFFADHPIFIIFLILGIVIVVIIGSQLVNVASDVSENELLANKSAEFTFANLVMGAQLPIIILVAGIVSVIIMISRRNPGGA